MAKYSEVCNEDEERRALIHKFYQIYRPLQKRCGLRAHMYFDDNGNNCIEIWECEDEMERRCICKVKEDTEIMCYRKGVELLESYSGQEIVRRDQRAG